MVGRCGYAAQSAFGVARAVSGKARLVGGEAAKVEIAAVAGAAGGAGRARTAVARFGAKLGASVG